MLLPGVRLVERPDVLHFFDGRRVVSVRGDKGGRRALRQAVDETPATEGPATPDGTAADAADDARDLLGRLELTTSDDRARSGSVAAAFVSAATAGWVGAGHAEEQLRGMQVHVWDGTGALLAALSASGLRCAPLAGPDGVAGLDPERSVVAVAASDEEPTARARAVNAACLARGVTWLPVGAYDGAAVQVGPLMIPGQTACLECLLRRLAANVAFADVFEDVVDAPAAPTPPALRDWSYSMASLILLRWIAARDAALPGLSLTLVPGELLIRPALVHRVPRCPACAGPEFVTAAAPWDLARDH